MSAVRGGGKVCPLRTIGIFRWGRPNFCCKKLKIFQKLWCPQGQGGGGWSSMDKGGGRVNFGNFVRTSFIDGRPGPFALSVILRVMKFNFFSHCRNASKS